MWTMLIVSVADSPPRTSVPCPAARRCSISSWACRSTGPVTMPPRLVEFEAASGLTRHADLYTIARGPRKSSRPFPPPSTMRGAFLPSSAVTSR